MANHVGVFADTKTFLEGKEGFFTFMKYTLCKHRSQLETTSLWEMYIFLSINRYTSLSI